ACGDQPGDAAQVAAVRADVESRCPCAAATSRADHVACVAGVAGEAVASGQLRRRCRSAVVRCAMRSTCGRPGFVTCCRTTADGDRKCRIRSSSESCTAPPGGTACVGDQPSCCDACATGTCAPTSTTLPRKSCSADTDCDDGNGCSEDRCRSGVCTHLCLCVGPAGGFTCCPGPAAECGPVWFPTCGDPVCSTHRDQGVRPCTAAETPGVSCGPEGERCDPGSDCNELLLCA